MPNPLKGNGYWIHYRSIKVHKYFLRFVYEMFLCPHIPQYSFLSLLFITIRGSLPNFQCSQIKIHGTVSELHECYRNICLGMNALIFPGRIAIIFIYYGSRNTCNLISEDSNNHRAHITYTEFFRNTKYMYHMKKVEKWKKSILLLIFY